MHWHLGLGDALVCNGLVHVLVARGRSLLLPCYPKYRASIEEMFSHLGERVEVFEVADGSYPGQPDEISLGWAGKDFDPARWDECFYRQAGIDFCEKWNSARLPPVLLLNGASDRFIHDDVQRGFRIPLSGFRPEGGRSIFDYAGALMAAKEIHCIDSCFAILADLYRAPGRKYLHRYAREGTTFPVMGAYWEVLKQPL
jgi:hypothetical protein